MLFRRALGVTAVKTGDGDYEFSLSSEMPVERWYGIEILEHSSRAVNLERLADGRHPLLVNHNVDVQVGVVRKAWLDEQERKVRVSTKFSRAPYAQEIKQDVEDDIRTLVSVGYQIDEVKEQKRDVSGEIVERTISGEAFEREMRQLHGDRFARVFTGSERGEDNVPVYRVTKWTPFEASIVSVPADITVGKGRVSDTVTTVTVKEEKQVVVTNEVRNSADQHQAPRAATKEASMPEEKKETAAVAVIDEPTGAQNKIDDVRARSAQEVESTRRRAIENFARANKIADSVRDAWIEQGYSLEQVSKDLLQILEERGRTNPQPATRLGLSAAETDRFSLTRAIRACAGKSWQKDAPYELEVSRAVAQKLNKVADENKFFVPFEVLQRSINVLETEQMRQILGLGRRDLTVATAGAGGYLVETSNVGFIDMLRNRSVAFRMGAVRLSGLQGNVTIPRQSAAGTPVWLANEASTATESQQTFVQVSLTPKTVSAYTEVSRQLLLQSSPGAEGIVASDLAQVASTAADLAVLNGSGASGQPTGIINTAGIGSVTGTSLAYAGVLEFQTDVAGSNVMPMRGGYATTPAVASLMMQRVKFSSTASPMWEGNIWDGSMAGFPAMSSNQMPAANMLFGDWSEVVVAEWGVLEIEVNPYANFQAGIVGVRALYTMDCGVKRPFAFSLATSIT